MKTEMVKIKFVKYMESWHNKKFIGIYKKMAKDDTYIKNFFFLNKASPYCISKQNDILYLIVKWE